MTNAHVTMISYNNSERSDFTEANAFFVQKMAYELYLNDTQMQVDETVISGLRWSASDRYRLLSKVSGVGCVDGT